MLADYKLHHVGVILPSLEDAERYMDQFALREDYRGYVDRWSCWCIFTVPAAGAAIELVVADAGPLVRFNKGMGGVHHFAYEVEDLREVARWCAERDLLMLEPEPVKGAGNFLCNFINPVSTRGVQIEFVQPL